MKGTHARKQHRTTLPESLSKLVQIQMHPEVHKELKIVALREDQTVSEWLHQHLCEELGRQELMLQTPDSAK